MKILISGGCKNGKSTIAEDTAVRLACSLDACCEADGAQNGAAAPSAASHLYYVATMIPHDDEDEVRIARHIKERDGKGFVTIECGENIAGLVGGVGAGSYEGDEGADVSYEGDEGAAGGLDPNGTYLIDSITALLSNEMFKTTDGKIFEFDEGAAIRVAKELVIFASNVKNVIFVSDYIFSDIIYDEMTEKYREGLALLDRTLAECCDEVIEVCLGNTFYYKK